MKIKKLLRQTFKAAVEITFWCCILAVACVVGQVFLFASFRIPSDSMQPALTGGDYVLVWKPTLGARLFNLLDALEGKKVGIYRLPGWRSVRRNDVLVFHFPYPHRGDSIGMHMLKYYIKRCVALPGDTFRIDGGIYRVNGSADTLGIHYRQAEMGAMADSLFSPDIFRCFPFDSAYGWTVKHFGPLYVPGRGSTVAVDTQNIVLYRNPIMYETGKKITVRDGHVCLDGERLDAYTFAKDYYFMAGDWVFDSRDSRYWGLLPDDLVVGRAALIWKSEDRMTGKLRWARFFRKIR
ncbi:MAG: signal peptidase I [Tannerella sp.]|jgi:signal peptidase I|nr:signal peptidase I [Tannerella sp.]